MTGFKDVVDAWRNADPKHIHPTREHESEMAYWESGKVQAEFVANLLPDGGTVLDFGCGDGRIAIPMAQLGLVVYACDAAPEMVERLQHQIGVTGIEGIQSFVSDGHDLPVPLIVDAVNCRAVLIHHSHADVGTLVDHLAACLTPGGLFIADWPIGVSHERRDWIDVTVWDEGHRFLVARHAGLELVTEGEPKVRPSVWVKTP